MRFALAIMPMMAFGGEAVQSSPEEVLEKALPKCEIKHNAKK